jgi:hypothetical protein
MSYQNRVVFVARRAAAALTLTVLTLWGVSPATAATWLLGDGTGGFGTPVNFTVGARTLAVLAIDFNGPSATRAWPS